MITPIYIGCDVSKATLDICILVGDSPRFHTYPNTDEGHADLLSDLEELSPELFVLEPTGGHERAVIVALQNAGFRVARVHANRVRSFARSCGHLAKTDRIDAQVLALFGERMQPAPLRILDKKHMYLSKLYTRRRHLVKTCAAQKQQLSGERDPFLCKNITQLRDHLKGQIAEVDAKISAEIERDAEQTQQVKRLQSVPGIGPVIAGALLAFIPELGTLTRGGVAAIVGVAPYARDSGRMRGRRVCQGGRKDIRDLLFMAAVTVATRKGNRFATFYQRLLDAGKPKKVALIAVMRKIVITLNAMERDKVVYHP